MRLYLIAIAASSVLGCGVPLYGNQSGGSGQASALGLGRDEDLARASAGATGCEPADLYIYNRDQPVFGGATSWGADCHGRSYLCSATGAAVSCSERGGGAKAAAASAPPAAPPRPAGVRRIKGARGHYLSLQVKEAPFELGFLGSPAQDRENVLLSVRYPAQLIGGDCTLTLMIDGEVQPALGQRVERTLADRQLKVQLPVAVLEKFVKPHRVAGRVCGEEWRISPEAQGQIEELLLRWKEELGWQP